MTVLWVLHSSLFLGTDHLKSRREGSEQLKDDKSYKINPHISDWMRSDDKGENLPLEILRKATGGGALRSSCWGAICPPLLLLPIP